MTQIILTTGTTTNINPFRALPNPGKHFQCYQTFLFVLLRFFFLFIAVLFRSFNCPSQQPIPVPTASRNNLGTFLPTQPTRIVATDIRFAFLVTTPLVACSTAWLLNPWASYRWLIEFFLSSVLLIPPTLVVLCERCTVLNWRALW